MTSVGMQAQNNVSTTGHVIAEVIPIFSAAEMSQMNFGRFSPGAQGGEIILTPESSVFVMGSIYKGSGIQNAASFILSGETNAAFTVTLPGVPVVLKHVSGSKEMLIENWTGAGPGNLHGGSQTVYIGATLKVGTLQDNPVGIYAGTYTITFDFN